jgi:hypothetical protein
MAANINGCWRTFFYRREISVAPKGGEPMVGEPSESEVGGPGFNDG